METLLQDLIKAFGWSILNSVWQSGIIYAVLFTILLVAPKLSAKVRHNLSYLSVCGMFTWFLYTFFNHVNFSKPAITSIPVNLSEIGFYLSQIPQTLSQKVETYFPLIVSAYLAGILIQLFVITKGYMFLRKLKTKQLSNVPEAWQAAFTNITASLGLNRKIKFQLSALVNVPVVVGYLKPIVLFPVSLVTQLDSEQVEAILIHELSHIRRNDYLLNLIKTCIETLMFFNPFVWLAGKFIQIEREHACDDLVLELSGKPLTYAHALLKLELIKDSATPAYALAATGKTQHLYQRIKRITNMKTNYLNTKQQMAALTLAVAGLLSVAWTNPTVKQKAKEVTKKISQTFTIVSEKPARIEISADTTKKKHKMKIVITDDKGVTKEYNNIADLPDSLRKNFSELKFNNNFAYSIDMNDSNRMVFKSTDSAFRAKFKTFNSEVFVKQRDEVFRKFNSPEAKAKFERFGKEMEKEFSSPEAQAKWKKFGEEMQKQFNSPEAKAKFEKFGKEMEKEFSSPEAKAKWEKFGIEMQKKFSSPEFRVKQMELMNKLGSLRTGTFQLDTLAFKDLKPMTYYTPDGNIKTVVIDGKVNLITTRRGGGKVRVDSLMTRSYNLKGDVKTGFYISDDNDLRNSDEYKKLKEKFENDVEALKKKKKEDNKDKTPPPPAKPKKVGAIINNSSNNNVAGVNVQLNYNQPATYSGTQVKYTISSSN